MVDDPRWVLCGSRSATGLLICLLAACATQPDGRHARQYLSLNGRFRAVIVPLPNAAFGLGESRVELRAAGGTLLVAHSYESPDGESGQGYGVERAAWTPDSRFFVYNLSSSGGHQPWTTPIDFISVSARRLQSLDDHVGSVVHPEFTVSAPDRVLVTVVHPPDSAEGVVNVSLAEIAARTPEMSAESRFAPPGLAQ